MNQDEIIEMAKQAGCPMADMMPMYFTDKQLLSMLKAFAKLVAAKEREACAKICDALRDCEENTENYRNGAGWCGEAIRARVQT
jgi:hypothetical protein